MSDLMTKDNSTTPPSVASSSAKGEAELLPCPFCGSKEVSLCPIECRDCDKQKFYKQAIECENCGSLGQIAPSEKEAIEYWNRRASQSVNKTSADLSQDLFCPVCGKHGDHTSGGCPYLAENAAKYPMLSIPAIPSEAVEKIRAALYAAFPIVESIGYISSNSVEMNRNAARAIPMIQEAISLLLPNQYSVKLNPKEI